MQPVAQWCPARYRCDRNREGSSAQLGCLVEVAFASLGYFYVGAAINDQSDDKTVASKYIIWFYNGSVCKFVLDQRADLRFLRDDQR